MPYYDVTNLVTVTKTTVIDKMPCGYGTLRTTAVSIWHQVSRRVSQRSHLLSKSPASLCQSLSCLSISHSYKSNIGASWRHVHTCRSFQGHLRLLVHRLRALCLALAGPGRILKYWEALGRSSGMSGRFECGFLTDVHFAHICCPPHDTHHTLHTGCNMLYMICHTPHTTHYMPHMK